MAGIYTTVARGTVTQANMKISAVDGTAFVDFGYLYQSNFSAGVNGWIAGAGTVSGNIDSIGGSDDWLRLTVNNTSGEHYARYSYSFLAGRTYKITITYYIPSGQTSVAKIYPTLSGYASDIVSGAVFHGVQDTATTITIYANVKTARSGINIYSATSGNTITVNDPGGDDVFYIKDVKIEENPLTDKLGHLLIIRDSLNRAIQVFPKAVGTTETEGAELNSGTCTAGKLYKITATEVNHFGTGKVVGNYFTSAGTETLDANNKVKEISTPSATGVTIVSTKGGTTFNFALKNSSFNYNDSSYTYEIIKVRTAPSVSTSTGLTAANEHLAAVDGGAFYFGSIDMTNYQDGRHFLWFKDSYGYVAFARIKSEVPEGLTFGSELLSNVDFASDTVWSKEAGATISGGVGTWASVATAGMSQLATSDLGKLYRSGIDIVSRVTGQVIAPYNGTDGIFLSTTGTFVNYITSRSQKQNVWIYGVAFQGTVDNVSYKQVTVPPATGALLENMAGTRNLIYKHASFNPNAISEIRVLHIGD